ncbi:MAG: hypothetical protein Q4F88_04770 [Eubacteriales bacterium]|nr:hypothetical protein [Eubacteriales bacterium]
MIKKKHFLLYCSIFLCMAFSICSFADENEDAAIELASFKSDGTGYFWYMPDGSSLTYGWHWLDSNHDGIDECYFINENGHKLINTITPDGYKVDTNGAWIINDVVQLKYVKGPIDLSEEVKSLLTDASQAHINSTQIETYAYNMLDNQNDTTTDEEETSESIVNYYSDEVIFDEEFLRWYNEGK